MGLYVYRLFGAATLDAGMYEGLEADKHVTWQAALTVVLTSVAAGLGATTWYGLTLGVLLAGSGLALVVWITWAFLMFHIGSKVLPAPETETDFGEMLRTTGFAAAPGLILALGLIHSAAVPVFGLATGWMFAAMVVAVRHALDYQSAGRAIAVCGLAAALCLAMTLALGMSMSRAVS